MKIFRPLALSALLATGLYAADEFNEVVTKACALVRQCNDQESITQAKEILEKLFVNERATNAQKIDIALALNSLYRWNNATSQDIEIGYAYLQKAYDLGFQPPKPVVCFPMGFSAYNGTGE